MPPSPQDPFPIVQQEVRAAWKDLSSKLHSLPPADRQNRFQALQLDINDLSDSIRIARQDRMRFNISEQELLSREKFVFDMQNNLTSLMTRDTSRAQHPLFDTPAQSEQSRRANGAFIGDELRQQQLIMDQQDEQLDQLASAVERIGVMGRDMHIELEEQGDMIDGLGDEFDDTVSRMKRVRQNLDRFIEETGPRQFCTIVSLCITFFVLTFLVVTT